MNAQRQKMFAFTLNKMTFLILSTYPPPPPPSRRRMILQHFFQSSDIWTYQDAYRKLLSFGVSNVSPSELMVLCDNVPMLCTGISIQSCDQTNKGKCCNVKSNIRGKYEVRMRSGL